MARMKITKHADDLPTRVADAAIEAAVTHAEAEGNQCLELVVMLRLRDADPDTQVDAATAGHFEEGEPDGAWLAAELLARARVVLKAMGKDVQIIPLANPIAHG